MDIAEINLPQGVEIFSETTDMNSLSKDDMSSILKETGIYDKIRKNTLVIINDAHRSTPSYIILDLLAREENHAISTIAIATGSHDAPTDKELRRLLRNTEKRLNATVLIHDTDGETEYYGKTSFGTDIRLNPILSRYDHILTINSVEPHYFAGFTGGVKSVIPGLAGKKTIEKNHAWSLDKKSGPTFIDDNPLQLDLWEGLDFLKVKGKEINGIQILSDGENIYHLAAGELKTAFESAVEKAKEIYVKKVKEKFDIIVSIVSPPLNRSLYQAQKGIENTRHALKIGGSLVLVAECDEGIGDDTFYNTMIKFNSTDEVIKALDNKEYNFGDHKAYKFATMARDHDLFIISDLKISEVKNVFAKSISIDFLEEFLLEASKDNKKIAVVLNGAMVTLSF